MTRVTTQLSVIMKEKDYEKIKYYKRYPIEGQRKFLELLSNGMEYDKALKQSNLDKSCLRKWIYEDNHIVDSDVEKCWENIEGDLCINNEYQLSFSYVNAACYDYDPFEELDIYAKKIDKDADEKIIRN